MRLKDNNQNRSKRKSFSSPATGAEPRFDTIRRALPRKQLAPSVSNRKTAPRIGGILGKGVAARI
jgi:hypothetical protein